MQIFIETIIYLLAIMGIIICSMSIFDICMYKTICKSSHKIYTSSKSGGKKVEIVIKFENINQSEKEEIINKVKNGDFKDIEEIVNTISIID